VRVFGNLLLILLGLVGVELISHILSELDQLLQAATAKRALLVFLLALMLQTIIGLRMGMLWERRRWQGFITYLPRN
jgi:hypothetical protein